MAAVNKVILVGNVGKDPDIRYTANNEPVANFTIATSSKYNGNEVTEWHRVSCFGKVAEIVEKYIGKGSQLYVEGRLRTREYDKNGQKHYVTEIIANTIQMLGRRDDNGNSQQAPAPQQRQQYQNNGRNAYADAKNGRNMGYTQNPDMDDEIPF